MSSSSLVCSPVTTALRTTLCEDRYETSPMSPLPGTGAGVFEIAFPFFIGIVGYVVGCKEAQ
jgi:hypothetical protein